MNEKPKLMLLLILSVLINIYFFLIHPTIERESERITKAKEEYEYLRIKANIQAKKLQIKLDSTYRVNKLK